MKLHAERVPHRKHSTAKENTSGDHTAAPLPLSPSSRGVSQTDKNQPWPWGVEHIPALPFLKLSFFIHLRGQKFTIKQDSHVNPVSCDRWINNFEDWNLSFKKKYPPQFSVMSPRHKTQKKKGAGGAAASCSELETDDLCVYM